MTTTPTRDDEHGIRAVWLDEHETAWVAFAARDGERVTIVDGTKSAEMAAARRIEKALKVLIEDLDHETRMTSLLRMLKAEYDRQEALCDAAFAAGERDAFHNAERGSERVHKQLSAVRDACRIVFGAGWWARFSYNEEDLVFAGEEKE